MKIYVKGEIKPAGNCAWYGLTEKEWLAIFAKQGNMCPICERGDRKMVTDHFHVRGWKSMPPEERKRYVRGIVCLWCNFRVLRTGMTIQKLKNAIKYLENWERRRPR